MKQLKSFFSFCNIILLLELWNYSGIFVFQKQSAASLDYLRTEIWKLNNSEKPNRQSSVTVMSEHYKKIPSETTLKILKIKFCNSTWYLKWSVQNKLKYISHLKLCIFWLIREFRDFASLKYSFLKNLWKCY